MSRWIDNMPAGDRAALSDAGRIGNTRFQGPETPMPDKLLISVKEAADMMGGIDPDTVYAMCGSAQLPHIRLGRRILISVEGLQAWIAANDGRDIFGGTS